MSKHSAKISEGLTYDDVLIVPDYSEILPSSVDTATYFTKNIKLNIPIVSAAMDTVTEAGMAIAIAQEGGIGVLHKNIKSCKHTYILITFCKKTPTVKITKMRKF